MPVARPVPDGSPPQAPNAKAGGPAQRPVAGPVVPLTETRIAPEELIGGPAAATGASVTMTKGEPLAAPSGRADDFTWPRGAVNVEPAVVEPAAPDTAAADRGCRRQNRQACPAQVGAGCLRPAQAGPASGATSSQSHALGLRAPERLILRVERLVRYWKRERGSAVSVARMSLKRVHARLQRAMATSGFCSP
jgi:hypothetical protein